MKIFNSMKDLLKKDETGDAWKNYRKGIFAATEEVLSSPPVVQPSFMDDGTPTP